MSADHKEGLQAPITLKQALIDATFAPGRVYTGPDVIDLATLQPDLEELIDYTLAHPKSHEAARVVYVQPDGKVITNRKIIEGDETHVAVTLDLNPRASWTFPSRERQASFVGSKLHSHPYDQVFTPVDLYGILLEDADLFCHTSELLITPARKILVFRGANTVQLSQEQSEEHTSTLTQIFELLNSTMTPADSPPEVERGIRIQNARKMFGRMSSVYDLQIFEGGVRDQFLRRVPAQQAGA